MGQHDRTFGRKTEPHTVIVARGQTVRHFTIRPWVLALSAAVMLTAGIGGVGAGGYLLVRDGMIGGAALRQQDLRRAYEERIAALRSQLDRYASRQMLDSKLVETKVDVLLDQQEELSERYDKLQPILERAQSTGLIAAPVPLPSPKPDEMGGDRSAVLGGNDPLAFGAERENRPDDRFALVTGSTAGERGSPLRLAADEPMRRTAEADGSSALSPELIHEIGQALDLAQVHQIAQLNALAEAARSQSVQIASTLRAEGIAIAGMDEERATGGPFEPVPENFDFEDSYADLDIALTKLQAVRRTAERLPLASPLAFKAVSSRFGVRSDPFLGRTAFHSGIDYAVPPGTDVSATAPGVVTSAGRNGGYGNMVEVDHGNGIRTRYAHLSSIVVRVGDKVSPRQTIGHVGSTGRSTGPHLHYEVRRDGRAVDPHRFMRAGSKIQSFGWS